MSARGFKSVEDVKKVAKEIKIFLDHRLAQSFDLYNAAGDILHDEDADTLLGLMYRMKPQLKANGAAITKEVPIKIDDQINACASDVTDAMFALGLIVGAHIADPTGKVSDSLIRGWVRHELAEPWNDHLKKAKVSPR